MDPGSRFRPQARSRPPDLTRKSIIIGGALVDFLTGLLSTLDQKQNHTNHGLWCRTGNTWTSTVHLVQRPPFDPGPMSCSLDNSSLPCSLEHRSLPTCWSTIDRPLTQHCKPSARQIATQAPNAKASTYP